MEAALDNPTSKTVRERALTQNRSSKKVRNRTPTLKKKTRRLPLAQNISSKRKQIKTEHLLPKKLESSHSPKTEVRKKFEKGSRENTKYEKSSRAPIASNFSRTFFELLFSVIACSRIVFFEVGLSRTFFSELLFGVSASSRIFFKVSEKVFVDQERVSGFPENGADLRGSRETSGEVRGTSGEVWETSGEPLDCCKVPQ